MARRVVLPLALELLLQHGTAKMGESKERESILVEELYFI